jgi:hypothetical protein
MHITEPPPRPRTLAPIIPEPMERIILKALEKNPDDRYHQMLDMVEDLETLGSLALSTRPTTGQPEANPPSRQSTAELTSARTPLCEPHFLLLGTGVPIAIPRQDEVLIGRSDPGMDMLVDIDLTNLGGAEAGVSRQHARLVLSHNRWTIEDLQSTNGTYVNKEPILPFEPCILKDGDTVDLGQMALLFHA